MSFETIIVSVALITVSTASYFLQASILEEIIFEDIKGLAASWINTISLSFAISFNAIKPL